MWIITRLDQRYGLADSGGRPASIYRPCPGCPPFAAYAPVVEVKVAKNRVQPTNSLRAKCFFPSPHFSPPDPDEPEPNWKVGAMRQSRAREGAGPRANARGSDWCFGFPAAFGKNLTR